MAPKQMLYFNGRVTENLGRMHGYICARSQKEAIELGKQCISNSFNRTELTKYWSPCWGTAAMQILGPQTEPGVFLQVGRRFYRFCGVANMAILS